MPSRFFLAARRRAALLPLAFVLLCASAAALAAPAPRCFDDWWRARLAEARARRAGPEALGPLRAAAEMRRTAADPRQVEAEMDALRALPDTNPLVAAEIDSVLFVADLDHGDDAAAAARAARLGWVREYLVAGPFAGTDVPKGLYDDLAKNEPGRFRRLATGAEPTLPLHYVMSPATRSVAAAVFYVRAAERTAVAFRYGADERARVLLDGKTLLDPPGRRSLQFDQLAAFAELAPGWHRVAFEVEQEDGPWQLAVRLTRPDGRPLDPRAVEVAAPADRAAAEREAAANSFAPARGATLPDLFEQAAKSGGATAKALRAQDLAARGLPDRDSTLPVTLAREAAAAAPRDADVLWILAVVDTDPARRREALERLLEVDPTNPGALRRLAGYHLEYERTEDSIAEARRSLDACGRPDPYLEGWAALARDNRGFPAGAEATLAKLVAANPRQVALLERLAQLYRAEGQPTQARRTFAQALAEERTNDFVRDAAFEMAADAGDVPAARKLVDEALAREPLDANWRGRLVHFLLADGRAEEALAQADAALALAPTHPGLLELRGEAQLALGDGADAAATWKRALAVAQDPGSLGDRIAAATGADESFAAEWTVPLDEARRVERERPAAGDPAAVVLSRTTAYQVRANGLAVRFQQQIVRVRRPDEATFARSFGFSYSPTLEQATVLAARLVRKDGSVVLAGRSEQPMLPDPEIRMWYDTRVVQLDFPRLEEGDLIDVRWQIADRGASNTLGDGYFGDVAILGDNVPVLDARVVVAAAPERPVRRRFVNVAEQPAPRRADKNGQVVEVFDVPPLPAYESAPLAPPPTARVPYVVVGTADDWGALGRMYAKLVRDQAAPDADVEELAKGLTAKAATRREKIRAVYDWVIENTRYVALELGIHALKPYDVPSVHRRRFGDCKDKATLMYAMLRVAGVDARIALVRTRDRGPIDATVPTFADFDHAIVYVPEENLWLDGTVTDHAVGEVPAGDRDSVALLVDAAGDAPGTLTRIPEMAPEDGFTGREETIAVGADGSAAVNVAVEARGDDAGRERGYFRLSERRGMVLANRLRRTLPDLTLLSSSFDAVSLTDAAVRFSYKARMERFARTEGNGLSAPLALAVPEPPFDRPAADRKLPVLLPPPSARRVVAHVAAPPGWTIAELPPGDVVESPWGRVIVDVRATARGADVTIDCTFKGGEAPLARIPELAAFVERATHALAGRIVMRPR